MIGRGSGGRRRDSTPFDIRTEVYDTPAMKGSEFLRKLNKLGARKGVAVRFVASHGHGSHGFLYFGAEFTTLKDRKKDIGPGLLNKMCGDLGIDRRDL